MDLSGKFYIQAAANFACALVMARWPAYGLVIFGVVNSLSFFIPGWKYYHQRRQTAASESANPIGRRNVRPRRHPNPDANSHFDSLRRPPQFARPILGSGGGCSCEFRQVNHRHQFSHPGKRSHQIAMRLTPDEAAIFEILLPCRLAVMQPVDVDAGIV